MAITKIRKRDGRIVNFDQERITNAIWKAAQAVGGKDFEKTKALSNDVASKLESIQDPKKVLTVEDVQDMVEKSLVENGHYKTAKAYILYREQHKKLRDMKEMFFDSDKIINDYIKENDWRVSENANVGYSYAGLFMHAAGSMISYYVLNNMYPKEISTAHMEGDFHIHDLTMNLQGYCAGWSLKQLLLEGFNGVAGKTESGPAKHLGTAMGQMVNFLGTLQNEWAGAQAFSGVDTYLAPFVRADKLDYHSLKQEIQQFMFSINTTSRWGGQSPFTNLTFDWTVPDDLGKENVIVGGKLGDQRYDDYQKEMDMINKAFLEVMLQGDSRGRVFTFPIPTYSITPDFDWNNGNNQLLFDLTSKFGLPNFQNFVNSELKPSDTRAMCCRLQLNLKELKKKTGGLFGFGESTGSMGVVTINLPRIGFSSRNDAEFQENLERLMYLAKESLEIKRKVVQRNIDNNLLPYTKRYLGNLNFHFSTIGLIGMHEACLNFLGPEKGIQTKEGKEFSIKTIKFMRDLLTEYQEQTGNIYNLEATPGEGTSYRLARLDKKKYPRIASSGKREPYYTNSSQLPVGHTDDIFEALRHQDDLQTLYTGGTIFHGFIGEKITGETSKNLVHKIVHNFKLPYFTITPTFSVCNSHGYIAGEHFNCPSCNSRAEVYSRVVGYYRPVQNWNKGKQEEFRDRKEFAVN
jgi:anaerobic ribonucleoside-triphosphate reductase